MKESHSLEYYREAGIMLARARTMTCAEYIEQHELDGAETAILCAAFDGERRRQTRSLLDQYSPGTRVLDALRGRVTQR